jgi:hypothetical protein
MNQWPETCLMQNQGTISVESEVLTHQCSTPTDGGLVQQRKRCVDALDMEAREGKELGAVSSQEP